MLTNALLLALAGQVAPNPEASFVFAAGDLVCVLGCRGDMGRLDGLFNPDMEAA